MKFCIEMRPSKMNDHDYKKVVENGWELSQEGKSLVYVVKAKSIYDSLEGHSGVISGWKYDEEDYD